VETVLVSLAFYIDLLMVELSAIFSKTVSLSDEKVSSGLGWHFLMGCNSPDFIMDK